MTIFQGIEDSTDNEINERSSDNTKEIEEMEITLEREGPMKTLRIF